MNNKGQSLVLFILIIPILIGIMALVIDCGKVLYTKSKQENTIELILEYTKEDLKNNTLEEEKEKDGVLSVQEQSRGDGNHFRVHCQWRSYRDPRLAGKL